MNKPAVDRELQWQRTREERYLGKHLPFKLGQFFEVVRIKNRTEVLLSRSVDVLRCLQFVPSLPIVVHFPSCGTSDARDPNLHLSSVPPIRCS